MNTNYIDLFVFVFLLTEFFIGINKGAILLIFDIIGFALAFILSNSLAPKLSFLLSNNFHLDKVIADKIAPLVNVPNGLSNAGATIENVSKTIVDMRLPKVLENFIITNGINPSWTVKDFITLRFAQFLLNAISYVVIFIVVILVVKAFALIVRKVFRVSPFLKWIDVILGGVLRTALSFTIIAVLIHLLGFVFLYLNVSNNDFFKMLISSRTYYISEHYFQFLSNYLVSVISNFK
ncbi:MAG: hypothetical protein ACP5H0_00625 [Caldisericum sp.]|uniref:hypothetical protein n=1 Tax=Caldisericum TaxID=693074 RepID=UPI0039FDAF34